MTEPLRTVRVWDVPTRLFHWTLLALICANWFTGENDDLRNVHRIVGECVAGLLVFRLAWGFIGGEHARFASFAAGPRAILAHLSDLMSPRPKRHLGHNPLGAVAVFLLLATTGVLVVTGLFASHKAFAGPFAGLFGLQLGRVHEATFRVLQGLVALHVLGVVVETVKARDPLALAMITGTKTRRADEPGADARKASLAALAAAAVLGAGATGALLLAPPGKVAHHRHHDGAGERDGERDGEQGREQGGEHGGERD